MKTFTAICISMILMVCVKAQDYHQTVRGQVIDKASHAPVEFASVTIGSDQINKGTITNEQGRFVLENVPVGRYTLRISFVGYETVTIPNLEVTTGKELVTNAELVESTLEIDEVEVKAFSQKEKPINSFAPVSARMFSVEESQRYAGSMNDVSRMAMNFAGVKLTTETTNEIVIRGNSPSGVLFRLEGVDIPNPTHYGDGGNTGGPMSMLNNNVLANSDFLTGAFPAEYGNALSGVFDLRLRNGNNQKHEFMGQTSLLGVEAGAEGPLHKKSGASYLINYRYTNSAVLKAMGVDLMSAATYQYEDLIFKLNFPTTRFGNFSVFGLGGKSYMEMFESDRDTAEERQQLAYESDYEMDVLYDNYTGVVGVTHSYVLKNNAYTKLILSASNITNNVSWDSLSTEDRTPMLQYLTNFSRTKYMAKFYINKKFNSRNTARVGVSAELQTFTLVDSIYDGGIDSYRRLRNFDGNEIFPHAYVQFQHRFTNNLEVNLGVSGLAQTSISTLSVEPRVGLQWAFSPGHSLNFGYGLHSRNTPVEMARQKVRLTDGSYIEPNKDLGFTISHHLVLGYDYVMNQSIRFKAEVYYQSIFDAVVELKPSSYSLLNRGSYTIPDAGVLTNEGEGYNYGVEFTAEKFMDRGMYFLSTLSLYESKYKGSDGIWRDNAFNSNYVFNFLGGKEFRVGKKKKDARYIKKLVIDGKVNWAGGQRYTPIDLEASRKAGASVYVTEEAYARQLPQYFRLDARVGYKWIGNKTTQEIALDIRNLTNRMNPFYIRYNSNTGEIEKKGFGMTPELLYRIRF